MKDYIPYPPPWGFNDRSYIDADFLSTSYIIGERQFPSIVDDEKIRKRFPNSVGQYGAIGFISEDGLVYLIRTFKLLEEATAGDIYQRWFN